jgi:hypothetical protein
VPAPLAQGFHQVKGSKVVPHDVANGVARRPE